MITASLNITKIVQTGVWTYVYYKTNLNKKGCLELKEIEQNELYGKIKNLLHPFVVTTSRRQVLQMLSKKAV